MPLWERKGQRGRELALRQAWLHSTFTRQFYYLLVDRNSQSTLLVRLGKLSAKIPPTRNVVSLSRSEMSLEETARREREQLGAVISRSGGSHFRASSLRGGIAVQSQLINMLSV